MAAKRASTPHSSRVTTVNPWILGGEGRLVDLFPLNPWLILAGRLILSLARHPIRTLIAALSIYCLFEFGLTAVVIPLLLYFLIAAFHIGRHWWLSPDVSPFRLKRY